MNDEDNSRAIERMNTEVPRIAVREVMKPTLFEVMPSAKVGSCLVAPAGFTVHNVQTYIDHWEKAQSTPQRRKGTYIAADIKSMLAWMDHHCDENAPVFAMGAENLAKSWRVPSLSFAGIGNYSDGLKPQWHDFNTIYRFPVTGAWTDWADSHGEWMSQGEFSEFVEKHLYEFCEPRRDEPGSEAITRMIEALGGSKAVATPAKMYEVANGIKIMVSEQVEVELDRATGEQTLKFAETHTGKGGRPVAIPKFFYIRLPIFFGEKPSLIGALLRYRNMGGGKVTWSYELFAPDLVVKEAFDRACTVVTNRKRVLYMGTPDHVGTIIHF